MVFKVAVIGGGVQGLASALCIAEEIAQSEITLIAEEFYPEDNNICSSNGFGIVISAKTTQMDNELVADRVVATMKYCSSFQPDAAKSMGILPTEAIVFYNGNEESLNKQVTAKDRRKCGYQRLTIDETEPYHHVMKNGALFYPDFKEDQWIIFRVPTHVIDTNLYLPWLMKKLENTTTRTGQRRVWFERRKINSFAELASSHHLVVNCSGLGAAKLALDPNVIAMRGQYIRVNAPLVDKILHVRETVIAPRCKDVLLGVTCQVGRYDVNPDPQDTKDIRQRCETLLPSLQNAKFLSTGVGLRPARIGGPRVELEIMRLSTNEFSEIRSLPIVHNYGHGSKGFAQHWGCALEVSKMASSFWLGSAKL